MSPTSPDASVAATPRARLGLRANAGQFGLLVLINAFVGGMVGLERTLVPLVGEREFGLGSELVLFSFVLTFGVVKAFSNALSGAWADRASRKAVLMAGWLVGVPVPFLLAWGPEWGHILAANALLGVSQGLAWSMTVTMKIDLVGPRGRGLAMGLNEAAGYGAVGVTALVTGLWAAQSGLRPDPFLLGIGYTGAGLLLSAFLVRDTGGHVRAEAAGAPPAPTRRWTWVARRTSWGDPTLCAASQAGLVNNLADAVSWTVFPLLFAAGGLGVGTIGVVVALYPLVWGLGQVGTGALADRYGRKPLVVGGLALQALGLAVVGLGTAVPLTSGVTGSLLLGVGTALAYPALLAVVGDVAEPAWRASAVGIYRFWRDMGYAVGAIVAGIVAGLAGLAWAVLAAAGLTVASAAFAARAMRESHPRAPGG